MGRELPPPIEALLRGSGLAGALAAAAGMAAAVAVLAPWFEAVAELAMLGVAEDRTVAAIAGWATLPGILAAAAGTVAAVVGSALAFDRHPGWTRPALLLAAAGLALAGCLAQLQRPPLDRFPDAAGALSDLRAVVGELPTGVDLALHVRPGDGATVALVAGVLVLVAVAAARDLDQR